MDRKQIASTAFEAIRHSEHWAASTLPQQLSRPSDIHSTGRTAHCLNTFRGHHTFRDLGRKQIASTPFEDIRYSEHWAEAGQKAHCLNTFGGHHTFRPLIRKHIASTPFKAIRHSAHWAESTLCQHLSRPPDIQTTGQKARCLNSFPGHQTVKALDRRHIASTPFKAIAYPDHWAESTLTRHLSRPSDIQSTRQNAHCLNSFPGHQTVRALGSKHIASTPFEAIKHSYVYTAGKSRRNCCACRYSRFRHQ